MLTANQRVAKQYRNPNALLIFYNALIQKLGEYDHYQTPMLK